MKLAWTRQTKKRTIMVQQKSDALEHFLLTVANTNEW